MNPINLAVEGILDEAVAVRLARAAGFTPRHPVIAKGKSNLDRKLPAFNHAAKGSPWLVIRDLDRDETCASTLAGKLLRAPNSWMCFRVAVPQIESWLLADRQRFAEFFRVRPALVPERPDESDHAKRSTLDALAQSTNKTVRGDMLPRRGSGGREGSLYCSRMIEFAREAWRPEEAAKHSASLDRALRALESLSRRWQEFAAGSGR